MPERRKLSVLENLSLEPKTQISARSWRNQKRQETSRRLWEHFWPGGGGECNQYFRRNECPDWKFLQFWIPVCGQCILLSHLSRGPPLISCSLGENLDTRLFLENIRILESLSLMSDVHNLTLISLADMRINIWTIKFNYHRPADPIKWASCESRRGRQVGPRVGAKDPKTSQGSCCPLDELATCDPMSGLRTELSEINLLRQSVKHFNCSVKLVLRVKLTSPSVFPGQLGVRTKHARWEISIQGHFGKRN